MTDATLIGTSVGRYRLERELARGGMGAVYAGVHELLGRPAAIKVLLPAFSNGKEQVERFFNEARAASAIRHPSIVEIYDFGYAADGRAYIVMELLQGQTLAARLEAQPLPLALALVFARQVANALGAAHAAGIVHRDLKPENVFLERDPEVTGGERVKLLDFGVAKLARPIAGEATTVSGALLGTPHYMSPEQCEGSRVVDHRSDLYSLGCVLYQMLTSRRPFEGEGLGGILGMHLHVAPPKLRERCPQAPAELEALVDKLLQKSPTDRYASAAEVAAALDGIAVPPGAVAPLDDRRAFEGPTHVSRAATPPRRRRWAFALVAIGAAGALATVLLVALRAPASPAIPDAAPVHARADAGSPFGTPYDASGDMVKALGPELMRAWLAGDYARVFGECEAIGLPRADMIRYCAWSACEVGRGDRASYYAAQIMGKLHAEARTRCAKHGIDLDAQ